MDTNKRFRLGDFIAKVTKLLGIPHCLKCEKRRVVLNELQEVGLQETIRKLKDCCN